MQEKIIFFAKDFVISKKSSTFAAELMQVSACRT